jgi:hypothetical protein
MNKQYFTMALALLCVVGIGTNSRAQNTDGIVVTVPFEFVVGANPLPAGTYQIERFSQNPTSGVVLRGGDSSTVVLPTTVESSSLPKALLTFQHIRGTYFLGKVETPGMVYTLATPRTKMTVAATHDQITVPATGTK